MKENGIICAGGLHKEIKQEYFRIGHMGISTKTDCDHIDRVCPFSQKCFWLTCFVVSRLLLF